MVHGTLGEMAIKETESIDVANSFWINGYVLLKDFFDEDEIINVEKYMLTGIETNSFNSAEIPKDMPSNQLKHDAWSHSDEIKRFLFSDKVLSLAKVILREKPTFWGKVITSFQKPIKVTYPVGHPELNKTILRDVTKRGIHEDARGNESEIFGNRRNTLELYPVIRFAHFFQDHAKHSYGIKLISQSHIIEKNFPKKNIINPPTRRRDLLIFNLKTYHSARALNTLNGEVLLERDENHGEAKSPERFKPAPLTRNHIFWDFSDKSRTSEISIRQWNIHRRLHKYIPPRLDANDLVEKFNLDKKLNLRYDPEILSLLYRNEVSGLKEKEKSRLEYLEYKNKRSGEIESCSNDIRKFRNQISDYWRV